MNFFSIPADFNNETPKKLRKLNEKYKNACIDETYGHITVGNLWGSGRANDLLPRVDMKILREYITVLKENGIHFNYILNASCMNNMEFYPNGLQKIIHFLDELDNMCVDCVTVAIPFFIELIKAKKYKFKIKVSTVSLVNNAEKALYYKSMGVDRLVVDESINRDFDKLKQIRNAFGKYMELIVNVICHKNCIYEIFHHNQTSHDFHCDDTQNSATYYSYRCMLQRCAQPENLLKLAWIRPEDLIYYENIGIHYYKIQGRQAALQGDVLRTVESYMQQSYSGDLFHLLNCFYNTNSFEFDLLNKNLNDYIKPFVRKPGFCRNYCNSCGYCNTYLRKHFNYDKILEMCRMVRQFYNELDENIEMVYKI